MNSLVGGVFCRAEGQILEVGDLLDVRVSKPSSAFGLVRFARCREVVFLGGARLGGDHETLCIPCSGYVDTVRADRVLERES